MYTLVIADDEKIEQRVLQKMVQEFCPEIRLLPGVSNGLKLVECMEQNSPDIVVLDINMPVMNGLDALEIIRLKKNTAKILVVTAYSRFEFAKKALTLGAEEYLLKPVNEQAFIQAVKKICAQLDRERQASGQKDMHHQEYQQALERELISGFLLGAVDPRSCRKYQELMQYAFSGVCAVTIRGDLFESEENCDFVLKELGRFCVCFGMVLKKELTVCIFAASEEETGEYQKWCRELFQCLTKSLEGQGTGEILWGTGTVKGSLEEAQESVRESQIALRGMEVPGIYFYEKEKSSAPWDNYDFKKSLSDCLALLEREDSAAFCRKIEETFRAAGEEDVPLNFLYTFSYCLLSGGYFQEKIPFSFYEKVWREWEAILRLKSAEEICLCLKNWEKKRFCQKEKLPERNPYICEALNYMAEHYQGELSLDRVAAETGVSSFYLSRLFKQEFARTFLEVLTDIRFTRGLDFLYRGQENIQQIGWEIGYPNVSYFYRLFKKKMGMTAGEMKEYLKYL